MTHQQQKENRQHFQLLLITKDNGKVWTFLKKLWTFGQELWPLWKSLDTFEKHLDILTKFWNISRTFGHFEKFWTILENLVHWQNFWQKIHDILEIFHILKIFLNILKNCRHFGKTSDILGNFENLKPNNRQTKWQTNRTNQQKFKRLTDEQTSLVTQRPTLQTNRH